MKLSPCGVVSQGWSWTSTSLCRLLLFSEASHGSDIPLLQRPSWEKRSGEGLEEELVGLPLERFPPKEKKAMRLLVHLPALLPHQGLGCT